MKKAIFFAATAALVLSSCSSDEITYDVLKKDVKGPKAIEVNAYTPGQTRSVATTTSVENGFWAYFSDPKETIYSGLIKYNADAEDPYYYFTSAQDNETELEGENIPNWPEDPTTVMTVYAITDGSEDFILDSEEASTLTTGQYVYTPETEAANTAQDVVVAKVERSLAGNGNSAAIELTFNHILAKVKFNAVGALNTTFDYKLIGLSFTGVAKDTYNFDNGEWAASEDAVAPVYTVFSPTASYNSMELGSTMSEVLYDGKKDNGGYTSTAETAGKRVMYAVPGNYEVTVQYLIKLKSETDFDPESIIEQKAIGINLVANRTNVINMTLPATNVPISITTKLNDWDNEDNTIDEDFSPKQ